MKIERHDDGSLRLSETYRVWRVLLLLMVCGAIVSWQMGTFPTEDWRGQVGLALAAGGPLLFALWLQDSLWAFDRDRQLVAWTRSRLMGQNSGAFPFREVRGVALQSRTNYEDNPKEPHVYRVALAVSGGNLPLSQGYDDQAEAEQVAAAVREALA
jgi:hypothetical protein